MKEIKIAVTSVLLGVIIGIFYTNNFVIKNHFFEVPRVHVTHVSALKEYEDCKKLGGTFWMDRFAIDFNPKVYIKCDTKKTVIDYSIETN